MPKIRKKVKTPLPTEQEKEDLGRYLDVISTEIQRQFKKYHIDCSFIGFAGFANQNKPFFSIPKKSIIPISVLNIDGSNFVKTSLNTHEKTNASIIKMEESLLAYKIIEAVCNNSSMEFENFLKVLELLHNEIFKK